MGGGAGGGGWWGGGGRKALSRMALQQRNASRADSQAHRQTSPLPSPFKPSRLPASRQACKQSNGNNAGLRAYLLRNGYVTPRFLSLAKRRNSSEKRRASRAASKNGISQSRQTHGTAGYWELTHPGIPPLERLLRSALISTEISLVPERRWSACEPTASTVNLHSGGGSRHRSALRGGQR